jgi:prepilin-type N-terminal cleavage/methylation domain-containing protein
MRSRQSGFSLLEMLFVVGIMGVLSTIAIAQIAQAVPAMKADGAMRVVMSQLNTARELAISQRRYIQVKFIAPNQMQVIRTDVDAAGAVTGTTLLSTVTFESGITYNIVAGLPDTPDAFGIATPVNFGAAATIQFATDGELIDQAGSPLNGTIVVASPLIKNSSRAVTVFGATGRVRGYRWNAKTWVLV